MSIGRENEPSEFELEQPDSGWNAVNLRGACEALSRTAPDSIGRISVYVPDLAGTEATGWLRRLAARLADDYGLRAEIEERGRSVCVIFTRGPIGS